MKTQTESELQWYERPEMPEEIRALYGSTPARWNTWADVPHVVKNALLDRQFDQREFSVLTLAGSTPLCEALALIADSALAFERNTAAMAARTAEIVRAESLQSLLN